MNTELSLELGSQETGALCDCCGTRSTTVHGFVYRAGDAFGIYYAGWSAQHPERGVILIIATGEWAEGSGPADRVSIGMVARPTDTEVQFTVIEPDQSPWGDTSLLGKALSRAAAIGHPCLRQALEVAELVVHDDPRIHSVLWSIPK